MLTIEEIKKDRALDFGCLSDLCEKALDDGVVSKFRHHTNMYGAVSIEVLGDDGKTLFCCSDSVSKDFIKEAALVIDKQYSLCSRPVFNDLIDIAVKAKKDGLLTRVEIKELSLNATSKDIEFCTSTNAGPIVIQARIDYINSLYTETFMINDLGSLQKVAIDANGVLANGSKFKVIRGHGQYLGKGKLYIEFENEVTNHASLEVLNGATVTQKRGAL